MTKIILTGTSGAGKSTLLKRLGERGHQIFEEAETPIVQGLKSEIGLEGSKKWILEHYSEFKETVGLSQKKIDSIPTNGKPTFYDRSAICYIGYCIMRNAPIPEILTYLANETKPEHVLFLERLSVFDERRETGRFMKESEAIQLATIIKDEYTKRGFKPIIVPEFSQDMETNLAERIKYVEGILVI